MAELIPVTNVLIRTCCQGEAEGDLAEEKRQFSHKSRDGREVRNDSSSQMLGEAGNGLSPGLSEDCSAAPESQTSVLQGLE